MNNNIRSVVLLNKNIFKVNSQNLHVKKDTIIHRDNILVLATPGGVDGYSLNDIKNLRNDLQLKVLDIIYYNNLIVIQTKSTTSEAYNIIIDNVGLCQITFESDYKNQFKTYGPNYT